MKRLFSILALCSLLVVTDVFAQARFFPKDRAVALSMLRSFPAEVARGLRIDFVDADIVFHSLYINNTPEVLSAVSHYLKLVSIPGEMVIAKSDLDMWVKGESSPAPFYVPYSVLETKGSVLGKILGRDVEVVDFSQADESAKQKENKCVPIQYVPVLHGGSALKKGALPKEKNFPNQKWEPVAQEQIGKQALKESPSTLHTNPEKAQWVVAYGDEQNMIRIAYLQSHEVIPLLRYLYGIAEDPAIATILNQAAFLMSQER